MFDDNNYSQERILFVDDEPNVLSGYIRLLKNQFDVSIALGGEAALEMLKSEGPFAVIISDIKMPVMDGIEFLSHVVSEYPDSVRMVLTGYADLEIAIRVVNSGDIFRFLTKPCDQTDLVKAIVAGIKQYRMMKASREFAVVQRMKEGLEGTLRAFTRLVEFRDPYTAGHMERVAEIAAKIAVKMGLETDRVQGLLLAGLVHDIGKVAVPSGILNRPGRLSDAEFAIIRIHPLVGAEAFDTLETPWPIRRIILEHHERIDGSGYPNGLTGDEMLLESKILAVADTIDATMTNRPYRPGLGVEKSIAILEEDKKTKLDKRCAEIGISLISEKSTLELFNFETDIIQS